MFIYFNKKKLQNCNSSFCFTFKNVMRFTVSLNWSCKIESFSLILKFPTFFKNKTKHSFSITQHNIYLKVQKPVSLLDMSKMYKISYDRPAKLHYGLSFPFRSRGPFATRTRTILLREGNSCSFTFDKNYNESVTAARFSSLQCYRPIFILLDNILVTLIDHQCIKKCINTNSRMKCQ